MFIDKNSIVINGVNMGQYLTEAKFGYNKLWASNTGRNLAGSMSGTLVGIFPKLTLQFGPTTREQLELLAPILDSANQTTSYYDPKKQTTVTMTTYSNDYEIVNKLVISGNAKNEPFSCSFIATDRRV